MKRLVGGSWTCLALLVAAGCGYDRKMSGVMAAWNQGEFATAASEIQPLLDEHDQDAPINGVVFHLDGGTVLRAAEDLPALKELYEQHKPRGFEILGVNLDPEKELVTSYIRQRGISWPQIHEDGGLESPPARKFGIITLPTMFLVDPEGRVISRNASVDDIKAHLTGDKAARK